MLLLIRVSVHIEHERGLYATIIRFPQFVPYLFLMPSLSQCTNNVGA